MSTLQEELDWLYSTQAFGIKLGLEGITRLLAACGVLYPRAQVIHVAGTNGKGSTCAFCESVARAALHQAGKLQAVIALVAEESSLVSLGKIHLEIHPVFHNAHLVHRLAGRSLAHIDTLHAGNPLIHRNHVAFRAAELMQQRQPLRQAQPHTQRGHLQAQHIGIAVYNQPAQAIGIAMNHAVSIGGFLQLAILAAPGHSLADSLLQVLFLQNLRPMHQHAQRSAALRVPETTAKEVAILIVHIDKPTLHGIRTGSPQHAREYRRVIGKILELHPGTHPVLTSFRRLRRLKCAHLWCSSSTLWALLVLVSRLESLFFLLVIAHARIIRVRHIKVNIRLDSGGEYRYNTPRECLFHLLEQPPPQRWRRHMR